MVLGQYYSIRSLQPIFIQVFHDQVSHFNESLSVFLSASVQCAIVDDQSRIFRSDQCIDNEQRNDSND